MDLDLDTQILNAIKDGIRSGIKDQFTRSYNNPLEAVAKTAVENHKDEMARVVSESIQACIDDVNFNLELKEAVRKQIAKSLIAKFGGEIEKETNRLKSDPTTRAKITLAIDNIIRGQAKP